jgi:hypothetical protein
MGWRVQVQAARLLLLLGDIFRAAGSPLGALPYILSCTQHAAVLQLPILVRLFLLFPSVDVSLHT